MISLDDACKLLGKELGAGWRKMAKGRTGSGFSLWHDREETVHVDFFGLEGPGEVDEARALACGLHAELKMGVLLQVDFHAGESDAFGAMVRFFEGGGQECPPSSGA